MDPWDDSHKRLDDRDRLAERLFERWIKQVLGEMDAPDGEVARRALVAADAFLRVRDEERRRGE